MSIVAWGSIFENQLHKITTNFGEKGSGTFFFGESITCRLLRDGSEPAKPFLDFAHPNKRQKMPHIDSNSCLVSISLIPKAKVEGQLGTVPELWGAMNKARLFHPYFWDIPSCGWQKPTRFWVAKVIMPSKEHVASNSKNPLWIQMKLLLEQEGVLSLICLLTVSVPFHALHLLINSNPKTALLTSGVLILSYENNLMILSLGTPWKSAAQSLYKSQPNIFARFIIDLHEIVGKS